MAVDDIDKICADFYREEEIVAAKVLLEQTLPERLPKRQGPNKCRCILADLLKALNDPNMSMPTYSAVDLTRLPPVSVDHCDVSAILAELQYLRSEVRALGQVSEEVSVLRQEIMQLRQLKVEIDDVRKDISKLSSDFGDFPPLSALPAFAKNGTIVTATEDRGAIATGCTSFADHAVALKASGMSRPKPRQRRPPVVGSSSNNSRVTAVPTMRTVDIFVSRLHPCLLYTSDAADE